MNVKVPVLRAQSNLWKVLCVNITIRPERMEYKGVVSPNLDIPIQSRTALREQPIDKSFDSFSDVSVSSKPRHNIPVSFLTFSETVSIPFSASTTAEDDQPQRKHTISHVLVDSSFD